MNTEPFVIERTLNAPIGMVWEAITNKEQMKEWYFDMDGFAPEEGVEFRFSGCGSNGEEYLHLCRVLEVVPGTKISYSWRYDQRRGDSIVTFELFEAGAQTRLKLTHEGLETFDGTNPDFAPESFEAGWNDIIGVSLPAYLAKTA